ncbi:hypothetical protein MRQ36_02660 [Micromonospora sp. R77]|uniref:hypothetical protein n=1 Tax=Micromonospora sp. R77 TaxID=2925836 RepID=UPI001F6235F9|nr:hypothetical protein [Micromonospora sp. R77]MCI4061531.1 hypothetical protein [Micromonospora sp. R77]
MVAAAPADGDVALPAGWVWHADPGGFRVAVPAGWWYAREGNAACFQDPTSRRILSVEPPTGGGADLTGQLRSARRTLAAAGRLPGYQEVRLAPVPGGAEWECRFRTPYGEQLHALRVLPADVGGWTLGWSAPETDWAAGTAQFAVVRQSFRPGRPTHSAG